MHLGIFAAVAGIALLDMVLSGDNALVIGAAASKLPRSQRRLAIIWGGAGAVVLRLLLAIGALELLSVPLLQAVGAVAIFIIAIRLLLPERSGRVDRRTPDRLWSAIATITIADVTMSMDNVIAVAGISGGNVVILVIGIALSMVLLFIASAIIARLISYVSWLLDLAAVVLAWTAANLILQDPVVGRWLPAATRVQLALHFGVVALILIVDLFVRAFRVRHAEQERRKRTITPHESSAPDALPTSGRTPIENG